MPKKKITLETLAAQMAKGFASADKKFEALAGDVATIKDDMATKDEINRLDDRIDGAIVKIDGVQNTLDAQTLARADQQLPQRVNAIEKHLGISKNITASETIRTTPHLPRMSSPPYFR